MSLIKILAVEDDPIYAESLDETAPDLILMDIEINDSIKGIELAARINSSSKIPIIFVTAFKDIETFQQAKLTLPTAYIIKPYDPCKPEVSHRTGYF